MKCGRPEMFLNSMPAGYDKIGLAEGHVARRRSRCSAAGSRRFRRRHDWWTLQPLMVIARQLPSSSNCGKSAPAGRRCPRTCVGLQTSCPAVSGTPRPDAGPLDGGLIGAGFLDQLAQVVVRDGLDIQMESDPWPARTVGVHQPPDRRTARSDCPSYCAGRRATAAATATRLGCRQRHPRHRSFFSANRSVRWRR